MKNLIFVILITLGLTALGQDNQKSIVIEGQTILNDVLSFDSQYLFPSFIEGTLLYTDNSRSVGEFNYNLLVDEMHFINKKKTVLAISNLENISGIILGTRVFLYLPPYGFMEQLVDGENKLLLKRKTKISSISQPVGVYGTNPVGTSVKPVQDFKLFVGANLKFDANLTQTIQINYTEHFYLTFNGKLHPFNNVREAEKAVGKKNKENLNFFLKFEGINFNNLQDLLKVTNWINSNIK
jgi:hypothetical protein